MPVINEKGWTEIVDVDNLRTVNTRPLGRRHVPVNHGEALDIFRNVLSDKDITAKSESGLLSPDDYKYVYVMQVEVAGIKDYIFNLGFINYNNKQKSMTVIAGETVMVCSNECYTGIIKESRRKHTNNVFEDIRDKFNIGVEYFKRFKEQRYTEINTLKKQEFGDRQVADVVLNMHRKSLMANTNIDRIIKEWDKPTFDYGTGGNTAWDFLNASTYTFKEYVRDPLQRITLTNEVSEYINETCSIDVPKIDV